MFVLKVLKESDKNETEGYVQVGHHAKVNLIPQEMVSNKLILHKYIFYNTNFPQKKQAVKINCARGR